MRDKHPGLELPREMVVFECNPPPRPVAPADADSSPAS
jgi:hypothetical protein